MYIALAWNQYYAKQINALANGYADKVKQLYIKDSLINIEYHGLNGGKWNHMMDQKRIGYTSWAEPRVQRMPQVVYVENPASDQALLPARSSTTSTSQIPATAKGNIFYERDGYVSINAVHYTRKKDIGNSKWKRIAGIAREGDAVALFPTWHRPTLAVLPRRLIWNMKFTLQVKMMLKFRYYFLHRLTLKILKQDYNMRYR
ncbi:hypothetical protein KRR40_30695 [Niabella defluvii]|nr:hypothetical protein KRR40_30695 [Niabella sp. I65]